MQEQQINYVYCLLH